MTTSSHDGAQREVHAWDRMAIWDWLFVASVSVALITYAVPCWFLALLPSEREHVLLSLRRRGLRFATR